MEPIDIRKRLRSRQGASGALPPTTPTADPASPPPVTPPPRYGAPGPAEAPPAYQPPRYQAPEPPAAEPTPAYQPPRYQAPEPPAAPAQAAPATKAKGPKLKGEVNKRMLILALGCAAVASILIVNYVQSSAGVLAQQSKLVKVATVAKDIPARSVITQEMIAYSEIPALYVPKGMATPKDTVVGKVALTAMYAGEQIHQKRLSDPNAETGMAVKIPNGHRAMVIQNRLAGLVKPGDFVDVFAIVNDKAGKPLTLPVLQRSLVLAVGSKVSATDTGTGAASGFDSASTASIAVPDQKVDLLTLLEEKGNFRLVLRAPNDTSMVPAKYQDKQLIDMILGADVPAAKPKPAAPKPVAPVVQRQTVQRPVRTYTPPVQRPAAAKPAPPKPAAPQPQRQVTVTVINGGNVQQQSQ
jgi:Flp pilus assembly protein CpaB